VKFKEVKAVAWTNTTSATAENKLEFVLDSPKSKPVINFFS